ncbi:hypothetical protein HK105_201771 [Polyrhizophydium stewartii]|uniref:VWFA domain-containing protein n=1 Tax=Polyrhizophydium stewartii TaxID=2732419 RepID=A0ABR4NHB5_9FUNG
MFKKFGQMFGAKPGPDSTPSRQPGREAVSGGKRSLAARAAARSSTMMPYASRSAADGSKVFASPQVAAKLKKVVADNKLHAWYGEKALQEVAARVAHIDMAELAQRMRLGPEVVFDLVSLALFDVVFFIDDSASMLQEDGSRLEDLKFILAKAAEVMTLFDNDGVQIRFINSGTMGEGIRSADHVNGLITQIQFVHGTPLGTNFKSKIVDPLVVEPAKTGQLEKPVLAIIITDGEPTQEAKDMFRAVVIEAKQALAKTRFGPGALSIQIGQVGTDQQAQAFLESLDNDKTVGNMIDCTSNYEMECEEFAAKGAELTPELWLLKLCLGAIDRGYDETDHK